MELDPFDDGNIALGIAAHLAAGRGLEDVVGIVVYERNQLRLQNGQLWKIIEKQRVIMEGLRREIVDLASKDSSRDPAADLPSIAELRKSITEHELAEMQSIRTGGKRASTYESIVDEDKVHEYNGLVDSLIPDEADEANEADLPMRGASLKQKNSFVLPSRTSSMMLNFAPSPSSEDLKHPQPVAAAPTAAGILSSFRESTSRTPPRKSSRPTTPLPVVLQNLNNSNTETAGSSTSSQIPTFSNVVPPSPSSATATGSTPHLLIHSVSLSPEDVVHVKVVGSSFQGTGADGILFFILVRKEKNGEEWKVEKRYSDFITLDAKLKSKASKQAISAIGKPPEKSLFTSMNPIKSDQRKVALEMYLLRVLDATPASPEVISFLTSNISTGHALATSQSFGSIGGMQAADSTGDIDALMNPQGVDATILKEGYLMKRGKNFGGWKPRYFRCKPYFLDYSEGPHREFSATISLKHCHIASIKPAANDNKSAHGLILIEFHKEHFPVPFDVQPPPESKIKHRHILAADSDVDRDDWVSVIFTQIKEARGLRRVSERHVTNPVLQQVAQQGGGGGEFTKQASIPYSIMSSSDGTTPPSTHSATASPRMSRLEDSTTLQKQASRQTIMCMMGPPTNSGIMGGLDARQFATTSQIPIKNSVDDNLRAMQQIPKPLAVVVVKEKGEKDTQMQSQSQHHSDREEKRAGAGSPVGGVEKSHVGPATIASVKGLMHQHIMRNPFGKKKNETPVQKALDPNRIIFGAPLEHGIAISRISDDLELPAIVYRCIEYLDYYKASQEEGIYRLSGTSTTIQQLKYLFNLEGDVDLINCNLDMMDVHVVSGLLKLYLRELPTPVLTKTLQQDFMTIANFDDRNDRVLQLSHLLSLLPYPNYFLLETLISHLVSIVQASAVNKMSVRNVGIVFAPTLGVPALVFILLLAEFNQVFCWHNNGGDDGGAAAATEGMRERIREMHLRKEKELLVSGSASAGAGGDGTAVMEVDTRGSSRAGSIAEYSGGSVPPSVQGGSPLKQASEGEESTSISPVSAILGTEGLISESEIRKIMG
ncbi:UNVERIFIED_CONTAM: hypothetical protein HDU68_008073 [Siphonaria sp. JEL0065]|nr:hypothetical protein HDU68_008073 [Siphonaria sp. JEL0065]